MAAATSIAFNFNRYLGLVGDFGGFADTQLRLNGAANPGVVQDSSGSAYTYLFVHASPIAGMRELLVCPGSFWRYPCGEVTLSSGLHRRWVYSSADREQICHDRCGGLDVNMSHHLALRLIQAEYLMTRFENLNTGMPATQNDMRLSSGLVFRFGGDFEPPPPVTLECSARPASVFPATRYDHRDGRQPESQTECDLQPEWSRRSRNRSHSHRSYPNACAGSFVYGELRRQGRQTRKEGLKPWESATATATFASEAI